LELENISPELMVSQKPENALGSHSCGPRIRSGQALESRNTKNFWTPAFAGVTSGMISWKAVESDVLVFPMINAQ
jgi:hypothetical protein